jgi:hypothetical protein
MSERHAKGERLWVGMFRRAREGVAFTGGEIFAGAVRHVQPMTVDSRGGSVVFWMSGPEPARPWRVREGRALAPAWPFLVTCRGPDSPGGAWRGPGGRGR